MIDFSATDSWQPQGDTDRRESRDRTDVTFI